MNRRTALPAWVAASAPVIAVALGCSEQPCTPPQCDVRGKDCQRRVMAATACIRGVAPRKVPVRVIRSDQYVDEALNDVDSDAKEAFERRARALAALGLERQRNLDDVVAAYVARVGAYYDPRADRVTLFEGKTGPSVEALVHEFAHALQHDVLDDLERTALPNTLDAALARTAMIEGDVTLTTDRAAMLSFGADPNDPDWSSVYGKWTAGTSAHYRREPLPVSLADRYFVYAFGAAFLEPVSSAGVEGWLRDPPETTRAVMAGAKRARSVDRKLASVYDAGQWRTQSVRVDAGVTPQIDARIGDGGASDGGVGDSGAGDGGRADAGAAPSLLPFTSGVPLLAPELDGFELIGLDSLGAFVLDSFARDQGASARALEADHLSLWYDAENDNAVGVYRLRFGDDELRQVWLRRDREQLWEGYVRTLMLDDDVVLFASTDWKWLDDMDLESLSWRAFDRASVPYSLRAAPNFAPNFAIGRWAMPFALGASLP